METEQRSGCLWFSPVFGCSIHIIWTNENKCCTSLHLSNNNKNHLLTNQTKHSLQILNEVSSKIFTLLEIKAWLLKALMKQPTHSRLGRKHQYTNRHKYQSQISASQSYRSTSLSEGSWQTVFRCFGKKIKHLNHNLKWNSVRCAIGRDYRWQGSIELYAIGRNVNIKSFWLDKSVETGNIL